MTSIPAPTLRPLRIAETVSGIGGQRLAVPAARHGLAGNAVAEVDSPGATTSLGGVLNPFRGHTLHVLIAQVEEPGAGGGLTPAQAMQVNQLVEAFAREHAAKLASGVLLLNVAAGPLLGDVGTLAALVTALCTYLLLR